jgi:dienelactone hydrolase
MGRHVTAAAATALFAVALVSGAGASRPPAALVHQFDYDAKAALDVKELSARRDGGAVLHDLRYVGPQGDSLPAYLLVPAGRGPFAAVVIQPGTGQSRRQGLPLARALAMHGIASLLRDPPITRAGHGIVFDIARDRAFQIDTVVEARRDLDLLAARPEIDARRLGFAGFSAGACAGATLAGVDRRVKAYVLQACGATPEPLIAKGLFGRGPTGAAYTDYRRQAITPFEPFRYVGGAAPAQLFFQDGKTDDTFGATSLTALYKAASRPKRVVWYDAGHVDLPTNPKVVADAVDWLTAELHGTP